MSNARYISIEDYKEDLESYKRDLELYKRNLEKAIKYQVTLEQQVRTLTKEKNTLLITKKQLTDEKNTLLTTINQLTKEKNGLLQHIKQLTDHIETLNAQAQTEQLELELIEAKKQINQLLAALEQQRQEHALSMQENKRLNIETIPSMTEETPPTPPPSPLRVIETTATSIPPAEASYGIWRLFGYKNQEAKPVVDPKHKTPLGDLTNANVELIMAENRLGKR